jgi:TRAP-type C4-dicarboxylate transport system substrate-binding protein
MSPPAVCLNEWCDKLEEMSGGRVKTVRYFNAALFVQREVIRSILAGIADIHFDYRTIEDPGLMQLNNFWDLPFLGWGTPENSILIYKQLWADFPELAQEFQGVKLLYTDVESSEMWCSTTKKQVLTSADLKGLKFISQGAGSEWFAQMGATPVNLSWPEFYTSMEKGIVDASMSGGFGATIASGMIELFKYYTFVPSTMRQGFCSQIINPNTWNKLPPDIQKIMNDLEPWLISRRLELERESNQVGVQMAKEKGAIFADLSPEVTQEWIAAAKPVHDKWIKDMEGKGKPGKALYDELMQLLQKYK